VDPEIVLLPAQVSDLTGPDDPFAWLAFQGRWGEKAPSFNNGPQGPALKRSWTNPIVWVEELGRPGAVALPPLGTASTDLFCSASAAGSLLFIRFLDRPVLVGAAVVLLVALLVLLIKRTRWRPSDPEPVHRPREAGQLFLAAARLQRHRPRPYLTLAAVVLLGGIASMAIAHLVLGLSGLGEAADLAGDGGAFAVPVALLAGLLVTVPVVAFVLTGAAVIVARQASDRQDGGASMDTGGVLRQAVHPGGGFRAALAQVVLLACAGVALAPQDLLKEVAILAERSDICEEIQRFDSHLRQFVETLEEPRSVGRKLEFIVQELFRESNTMSAKSSSTLLNQSIVELKADVDRLKEQVVNVE
jgi:hypothetical protein